jgi:integrase
MLSKYLSMYTKPAHAPLFALASGHLVTYFLINSHIKFLARQAGFQPDSFSTHSLRAGAATVAAAAGMTEQEIQRLGRWRSDAYRRYLRPPPADAAWHARRLVFKQSSSSSQ